jgi:hypothetical protein
MIADLPGSRQQQKIAAWRTAIRTGLRLRISGNIERPIRTITTTAHRVAWRGRVVARDLAAGESAIKCPSPLNVLKDTYNHSCY